jgi:hypothetical protein
VPNQDAVGIAPSAYQSQLETPPNRSTSNVSNQLVTYNFLSKQNQADAYQIAQRRAESTGKRHRLVDDGGCFLDRIDP